MFKRIRGGAYRALLNKSGVFDNRADDALPQTAIRDICAAHFEKGGEKRRRVLLYGFDGARADSMFYLLQGGDESITGYNFKSPYSAVTLIKERGTLMLTYAGGCKSDSSTLQETSTAQGWAAILTGKWGKENGVQKHVTKLGSAPTILLELAEKGQGALFASSWQDHFTVTYKDEIKYAEERSLPLEFRQVKDEVELQQASLEAIDRGDAMIFSINEFADHNGHSTGFGPDNYRYVAGITNADRYAFELIRHIESRPEFKDEDWLYIITSDHGGHQHRHGTQDEQDRMTFAAISKALPR